MRVILGGGGNSTQSLQVDTFYRSMLPSDATVAFIPHAVTESGEMDEQAALNWLTNRDAMKDVNVNSQLDITRSNDRLSTVDSHFIMGGNTFQMVKSFRESGYNEYIKELIYESDTLVYGCSAGAIYMGNSIKSASVGSVSDENEVGLEDMSALNIIKGFEVYVHYEEEDLPLVRQMASEENRPVLAISEYGGVFWDGVKVRNIGADDIHVVMPSGWVLSVSHGESFDVM